jgi:preprotein translocase subunit YajC
MKLPNWAKILLVLSQGLTFAALADAAPAAPGQGGITPFLPLILIFGIFYVLILRPQQKKQKQHDTFVQTLKRGDMVITASGIIGTIRAVSEKFVTLEIDDGVCFKILKNQIAENANTLKEEAKPKGSLLSQLQEDKK